MKHLLSGLKRNEANEHKRGQREVGVGEVRTSFSAYRRLAAATPATSSLEAIP